MDRSRGWWAVYTRHHHEQRVAEILEAKGLEVFHATYQSRRRWKDRIRVLPMPLFPCYIFVRETAGSKLQVVSTPGVHMIVARGEKFALVPNEEIEAIRKAAQSAEHIEPCPYLKAGERVRVIQGPMKGIEGILLRHGGQYRLVLSVELLGRSASVEVGAYDIEALEIPPHPLQAEAGASWGASSLPQQPAMAYLESANEMRCL